ncbi:hypothetical protein CHS0354_020933 [Potamilus streckersoni]|uniref:Uncharacterized protein n=1 Tax=Potamilus streckersoni TaxID=2493646 RepID=A0AAE0VZM6_9BIVA|nr:hypothetical protein CHS0354_020933 [Potamilus streckersoni]
MDFTQRILTFGLIFGVVNGQVQTNAIVTSAKSKENVGIAAVQSPIELGFELGKRRKDPGGLPITNFLESNFVKDTSIRLPSVGITTTEEMISASNLKVLPSDNTGTHRPTTVSATTLTDLIWSDRADTGTTDASSGSNAWVLPSTTTDKSRGWAPSTQIPGSRNLDIWDTQSARAADGMGLMSGMMTTDRPGIRLDLLPHIVKLLGGFF